jgi:class 3 adenylate cyclase
LRETENNSENDDSIIPIKKQRLLGEAVYDNDYTYQNDTSVLDLKTLHNLRQDRLWNVLKERYHYNTSVKRGQDFLLSHVNSKLDLIIMYADLVGSTKMSMTLPIRKLVTIISAFSHELSLVVESCGGFVLKYVGDAIISFFPSGFNKYLMCDKAYRCAKSMITVLKNDINPILSKYNYPDLKVKIGIAEGENVVIRYGNDKGSQIDLIGYVMNVASKITSITHPNKVSVGGTVYKLLHPKIQSEFEKVPLDNMDWKYIDMHNGKPYKIYTNI